MARPGLRRGLGLWAMFILLDEVLLIFETGAEATHLRLLIAQLLTLVLVRPRGSLSHAARPRPPPTLRGPAPSADRGGGAAPGPAGIGVTLAGGPGGATPWWRVTDR